MIPRNLGQIVCFQMGLLPLNLSKIWARYKLFFDFPMHLLHFSHWEKIIGKYGDHIWDQTNWGYLRGSMITSTKIKCLVKFCIIKFISGVWILCNENYVSWILGSLCIMWFLFGSIWSRPDKVIRETNFFM